MPRLLRLLRRGPGGGVWLLAGVMGGALGCAAVVPLRPPASEGRSSVVQTAPPIGPPTAPETDGQAAPQIGQQPTAQTGPSTAPQIDRHSSTQTGPQAQAATFTQHARVPAIQNSADLGHPSTENCAKSGSESKAAEGPESTSTQGPESKSAQGPESKSAQGPESISVQGAAGRPVTLAFVGDILFGHFHSRGYARHHRPEQQPLSAVSDLLAADLSIANLETPIVSTLPARSPVNSKYRFGAAAGALAILRQAGIGAVSVANNHAADLKEAGLLQTPALLREQGITPLGEARLPADSSPFVVKTLHVGGLRLGIVAATTQLNVPLGQRASTPRLPVCDTALLPQRIAPLLRKARADHDVLVVLLHWGSQFTDLPSPTQRRSAHALIDAGADLVIGHHPHVLQGLEPYRRGLIAYSLGNFLFPDASGLPRLTGVLRVQLQRDPVAIARVEFLPAVARSLTHRGVAPHPAQGRAAVEVLDRLRSVSAPLGTRLQVLPDRAQLSIAPPPIAPPPIAPPNQVPPQSPLALSPQ